MSLLAAITVAPAPAPADLLDLPVLRTALLELSLLAVAGGLIGTWIVLHRLAFFAHATGTATFPGLVVAEATTLGARPVCLAVALAFAAAVARARERREGDVATGLVLVAALALGVLLASDVFESGAGVDRLLFGSVLGLERADVVVSGVLAVAALLASVALGRAWTTTAFDPEAAAALGVPRRLVEAALLALVASAAVAALPAVGALLVSSLFVVPAATARLVSAELRTLLAASVAIALAQSAVGLYVAFWLDVPPGPAIAVIGSLLFVVVALSRSTRALAVAGG